MRPCKVWIIGLALALAACSGGRNDAAARACNTEIGKRMNGRSFSVDLKDLAARGRQESGDTWLFTSTVILDKGLASENKQTYECRVRFDAQDNANVLYLQFNWNTSDLKRAQ